VGKSRWGEGRVEVLDCEVGTRWREGCKRCRCSSRGVVVCHRRHCGDNKTGDRRTTIDDTDDDDGDVRGRVKVAASTKHRGKEDPRGERREREYDGEERRAFDEENTGRKYTEVKVHSPPDSNSEDKNDDDDYWEEIEKEIEREREIERAKEREIAKDKARMLEQEKERDLEREKENYERSYDKNKNPLVPPDSNHGHYRPPTIKPFFMGGPRGAMMGVPGISGGYRVPAYSVPEEPPCGKFQVGEKYWDKCNLCICTIKGPRCEGIPCR
jgi:hypothetical protein